MDDLDKADIKITVDDIVQNETSNVVSFKISVLVVDLEKALDPTGPCKFMSMNLSIIGSDILIKMKM